MIQSTTTKATNKKSVPTIQCRVQKHAPEARKMIVAAIDDEFAPVWILDGNRHEVVS